MQEMPHRTAMPSFNMPNRSLPCPHGSRSHDLELHFHGKGEAGQDRGRHSDMVCLEPSPLASPFCTALVGFAQTSRVLPTGRPKDSI